MEYTRTARVDLCEPVCHLVEKLRSLSEKCQKLRTYVDNCLSVFPLLKESYSGKFIELDFSQNLSFRPKDEVQSTHFSGKQFTLHCAIAEQSFVGTTTTSAMILSTTRSFLITWLEILSQSTTLKMKIFGFRVIMLQPNTLISTLSVCIRSWQMILIYASSVPTEHQVMGKV